MVICGDVSYVHHRFVSFKGEACHDEKFQHLVNSHNLPLIYRFEPKYKSSDLSFKYSVDNSEVLLYFLTGVAFFSLKRGITTINWNENIET